MREDGDDGEAGALHAARRPTGAPRGPKRRTSRSSSSMAPVSTNGSTTSAGIPWVQPRRNARSRRGPVGVGEDVDVGQVGADEQRRGAEGGALPETAARQRGADQRVADRIYASLASSSICTLPLSACETGQPSLAFSAAASNPAWSRPGHLPANLEPHLGDPEAVTHLLDGARRLGADAGGAASSAASRPADERHAETGGVRGGDQLLGVGAFRALEPGRERVVAAEGAGAGAELSVSVAKAAFPDGARSTGAHAKSPRERQPVRARAR